MPTQRSGAIDPDTALSLLLGAPPAGAIVGNHSITRDEMLHVLRQRLRAAFPRSVGHFVDVRLPHGRADLAIIGRGFAIAILLAGSDHFFATPKRGNGTE